MSKGKASVRKAKSRRREARRRARQSVLPQEPKREGGQAWFEFRPPDLRAVEEARERIRASTEASLRALADGMEQIGRSAQATAGQSMTGTIMTTSADYGNSTVIQIGDSAASFYPPDQEGRFVDEYGQGYRAAREYAPSYVPASATWHAACAARAQQARTEARERIGARLAEMDRRRSFGIFAEEMSRMSGRPLDEVYAVLRERRFGDGVTPPPPEPVVSFDQDRPRAMRVRE